METDHENHLTDDERSRAFRELARVLRPHGRLLVSFHVDGPDFAPGEVDHLTQFLGHRVDLDGHFLEPRRVEEQVADAGLTTTANSSGGPSRASSTRAAAAT